MDLATLWIVRSRYKRFFVYAMRGEEMDNFTPSITFIAIMLVGIMVSRLNTEIKEIKKLLGEIIESSRTEENDR